MHKDMHSQNTQCNVRLHTLRAPFSKLFGAQMRHGGHATDPRTSAKCMRASASFKASAAHHSASSGNASAPVSGCAALQRRMPCSRSANGSGRGAGGRAGGRAAGDGKGMGRDGAVSGGDAWKAWDEGE